MNKRKPHLFGLLHRYGGITSAIAVIIISSTGLLLNHTDELQLDQTHIDAPWLLNWYGIELPNALSFSHQNHIATQMGERIWVNTQEVASSQHALTGIVTLEGRVVVATTAELFLLTTDLKLIERIDPTYGLPTNVVAAGVNSANQLMLRTAENTWKSSAEAEEWTLDTAAFADWSVAVRLKPEQLETLKRRYRGKGLSLERIILDLHSGRVFGPAGRWLADIAALLFILLAMTGIWMWFKTKQRKT